SSQKGIHLRPCPPREVCGSHRRRLGRGEPFGGKDVYLEKRLSSLRPSILSGAISVTTALAFRRNPDVRNRQRGTAGNSRTHGPIRRRPMDFADATLVHLAARE